ncbi:MAG: hypothetical protein HQL69_16660 [Magnetococcales bacterium]|nr:hypothetical protein [Magnetococcales bacterium]
MSLHAKYRPVTIRDFPGREKTTEDIQGMIHGGEPPKQCIMSGQPGMGKTAMSSAIANELIEAGGGSAAEGGSPDAVSGPGTPDGESTSVNAESRGDPYDGGAATEGDAPDVGTDSDTHEGDLSNSEPAAAKGGSSDADPSGGEPMSVNEENRANLPDSEPAAEGGSSDGDLPDGESESADGGTPEVEQTSANAEPTDGGTPENEQTSANAEPAAEEGSPEDEQTSANAEPAAEEGSPDGGSTSVNEENRANPTAGGDLKALAAASTINRKTLGYEDDASKLKQEEKDRLTEILTQLKDMQSNWRDMARLIREVNKDKLYREKWRTFENFCEETLEGAKGANDGYELMYQLNAYDDLAKEISESKLPRKRSVYRPLISQDFTPEDRIKIFNKALEISTKKIPTMMDMALARNTLFPDQALPGYGSDSSSDGNGSSSGGNGSSSDDGDSDGGDSDGGGSDRGNNGENNDLPSKDELIAKVWNGLNFKLSVDEMANKILLENFKTPERILLLKATTPDLIERCGYVSSVFMDVEKRLGSVEQEK